ncbi:hypothetical protein Lesp02_18080 [Lentzea sp. NBRC 105346]|nr:hypothetical protein Lesp02_18080 [Lentzea sp. NBRC 105346]
MFLHCGGGSGFSGLHGQPEGVAVVVGAGGLVSAGGGGGGGADVWFCVAFGAWTAADEGLVETTLLDGALDDVDLLALGVLLIQVDAGVLLNGSSSAPPITTPTSTPSSAEPSTAEPDAAHSARKVPPRWFGKRGEIIPVGDHTGSPNAGHRSPGCVIGR